MATDRFANYAELSAVFVEGTDYIVSLAKKGSPIGITAYHGGGIEIGTTELMRSITDKRTSWSWYGFEALLPSDNRDLHITSVNYDEPRGVDWLTTLQRAVSLHGAEGDTPVTYIGGLDTIMRRAIQYRLEAKGFVVAESPPEIAGMQPENFVNRPPRGGVQLEMSTQLRKDLFLNGDWSRSARTNKANWTQTMYNYTDAIIEGVEMALALKLMGTGQLSLTDMNDVVASATKPTNPIEGTLWYDTVNLKLYVYTNGVWKFSADGIMGGKNEVINSTFNYGLDNWSYKSVFTVLPPESDKPTSNILQLSYTGQANDIFRSTWCDAIEINADGTKEYTISFDVRTPSVANIDSAKHVFFMRTFEDPTKTTSADSSYTKGITVDDVGMVDGQWKRHTITIKPSAGKYLRVAPYMAKNGLLNWREIKVEKGAIPTTWTKAPEDVEIVIGDIQETLGNMANDGLIDINERQVVKDKLTDIIGYVIADSTTTMPTTTTNDAGTSGKGSFYFLRKNAVMAGLSTTDTRYVALATEYNNLKTYLEGLTPVDSWDVSTANKDAVIAVTKATFRDKWTKYYTAEKDLANATADQLKKNVDNVNVGGTNYASNGNFEFDFTKSLWNSNYIGQTKEVVDISTESPPFKYALHVKNTTNANAGIFSPILWDGVSAEAMVNKEITISYWLKYSGIVQGASAHNLGRFGELIIEGTTATSTKVYRYPRIHTDNTSTESLYVSGTNTTWVKYTGTHKLTLPATAVKLSRIQLKHGIEGCVGEFWTTGLKVEIGNKATDWSQSPMDVNARMSDVEFKVTKDQIYASLTQVEAFNATMNAKQDATEFNFEKGMANWYADHALGTPLANSSGVSIVSGVGVDGTNVLQVASPSRFIFYGKKFPVVPNHIYQVTFRVRQTVDGTAGTNKVYAGVGAYDVNRAPLTTSTLGSHRYCAISAKETVSADGWQTYVGTITGEGNEDVGQFIPNTRYVTPMFIVNYSGGTGTAQIDYCGFEDITALDGLAQQVNSVVQTMTPEGINTVITETTAYGTLKNDLDGKAKAEDLGTLSDEIDKDLKDIQDSVDGINAGLEALDIVNKYQTKQEAIDTAEEMTRKFSATGGMNLLRNSIGYADFITSYQAQTLGVKNWYVQGIASRVEAIHTNDLDTLGFGSGFYFSPSVAGQNTSIDQLVTVVPNKTYTLSWYVKKDNASPATGSDGQFRIIFNEGTDTLIETYANDYVTSGFEAKAVQFTPTTDKVQIRIYAHGLCEATITGLMFTIGDVALQWSLATGETYNTTTRIDINGVRVSRYEYDASTDKNIERGYVQITPSEFAGYWDSDGDRNFEKVFYLNGEETVSKKVVALEEITMGTVKIIRVPNDPIWKPNTHYNATDTISVGRNVYTCTTSGVTGGAKPTHTSGTATDGTVVWTFKYTSANIGWAFTPIE